MAPPSAYGTWARSRASASLRAVWLTSALTRDLCATARHQTSPGLVEVGRGWISHLQRAFEIWARSEDLPRRATDRLHRVRAFGRRQATVGGHVVFELLGSRRARAASSLATYRRVRSSIQKA